MRFWIRYVNLNVFFLHPQRMQATNRHPPDGRTTGRVERARSRAFPWGGERRRRGRSRRRVSPEHRAEVLPAVADRVPGVGMPPGGAAPIRRAVAVVAVPEQVAILCHRIDGYPARRQRPLPGRDHQVAEVAPAVADHVPRVRMPPGVARPVRLAVPEILYQRRSPFGSTARMTPLPAPSSTRKLPQPLPIGFPEFGCQPVPPERSSWPFPSYAGDPGLNARSSEATRSRRRGPKG